MIRMPILVALCAIVAVALPVSAQDKPAAPATKTIAEVTKNSRKFDGLFTVYQDTTDGTTYMLIRKEQFGREYIYFSHTENSVVEASHFRGAYEDDKILSIRKHFNRIEFINENTSFYFDKNSALSKAANANISDAILSSQSIAAKDTSKGEYLIKSDDLFLSENLSQIKPSPNPTAPPGTTFSLGGLSKEKSKILRIKNYPANTDVQVEYVYENPLPVVTGGPDVTDARFVSITLQHSLIEMPKNDYVPRFDDPRIGYFSVQVNDMTSTKAIPYHDMIVRWNLVKKDKGAAISEPVEPIVWWIENTTPVELRETIKNAVLVWNGAFEAAGFRNAIQVKVQPDSADWDAGDIRYNVLRWTSSPQPLFGGYGAAFVNPRTGQILGSDIMLEYVAITNRLRQEELFDLAALNREEAPLHHNPAFCSYQYDGQTNALFGLQALEAVGVPDVEKREFIKSYIYELVLHEVGHTLGLNHNMKASQFHSMKELNNRELTSKVGLMASVMDYSTPNIALDRKNQGEYYTTIPGPYDRWAIEFGYSEAVTDESVEKMRLAKILSRSTEPALMFGNDADDMRSPGKAIDPRVNTFDMSNDAISYAIDRMKLVTNVMGQLKQRYTKQGQSYHELRNGFLILGGQYANAASVISRYIGGVYVDRAFADQPNAGKPFTAVTKADQKRAMGALKTYIFAPGAFKTSDELYNYLQQQRRGFNFFGGTEDPKLHDRVLNIQRGILDQLLHPVVLTRITDSRLYGNQYSLAEFMGELTDAVMKDDAKTNVNSFRQNLQLEYVNRLSAMISPASKAKFDYASKSMAVYHLRAIQKMLAAKSGTNAETQAHTQNMLLTIQKAFDTKL